MEAKDWGIWLIVAMVAVASMYVANLIAPSKVVPAKDLEEKACAAYFDVNIEDTYYRKCIPLTEEEQRDLYGACLEFDVDYEIALAVIKVETEFQNVTGDNGKSKGYMQIQPRWWSGLMQTIGTSDLMIAKDNFRTGCAILSALHDIYGTWAKAIGHYNGGCYDNAQYAEKVYKALSEIHCLREWES